MVVYRSRFAGVAELADARDLKSREVKLVPVRARSPAPEFSRLRVELGDFFVTYQLSCVGVDAHIDPKEVSNSHWIFIKSGLSAGEMQASPPTMRLQVMPIPILTIIYCAAREKTPKGLTFGYLLSIL